MTVAGSLLVFAAVTLAIGGRGSVADRRRIAILTYAAGIGVVLGAYIGVTNSAVAVTLGIACMAVSVSALHRFDRRGRVRR